MQRSRILDSVLSTVLRTALVFSLYLLVAGHNGPGGGFIGGLVAAAAFVLIYAAGGAARLERFVSVPPEVILGTGLTVAMATGVLGWVWGGEFLESATLEVDVPVLGTIKTTSALPFDVGVYVVVVGLAIAVLGSLGAEAER